MVSFKFDSLPKLEFILCRCITKPRVDSTQFNAVDYIYWLFGCHWTSRSPLSLNGMYGCLGPFVMAVKCWNVQCLGLIASLFSPRWKRKSELFFFSSRVQLLTLTTNLKLAMRVIQIKKTTGNARLSSSTEWNYSVEKGRHVWLTMTVVFRNHN